MKTKILFFIVLITHLYFNLLGGSHGFYFNFISIGAVNIVSVFYLLKTNPFRRLGLFLIFFPFFLLSSVIINGLINGGLAIQATAIYMMFFIATLFGILLYKIPKRKFVILAYLFLYPVIVINYHNIYNFIDSITSEENINIGKTLPEIVLSDTNGNSYLLNNLHDNNVLVLDLWSIHCSNCIQAFPKFEKLKNDFINDDRVAFFSVNIYDKKTDIEKSEKFLKPYTFKNYHTNRDIFKIIDFQSVPNYLIIGKDGKVKYFGDLNVESYKSFNNIYKLIDNEL